MKIFKYTNHPKESTWYDPHISTLECLLHSRVDMSDDSNAIINHFYIYFIFREALNSLPCHTCSNIVSGQSVTRTLVHHCLCRYFKDKYLHANAMQVFTLKLKPWQSVMEIPYSVLVFVSFIFFFL